MSDKHNQPETSPREAPEKDIANRTMASRRRESESEMYEIEKLFRRMKEVHASDLHLKSGQPPLFRVNTELKKVGDRTLTEEEARQLIFDILTDAQKDAFMRTGDLDFSYGIENLGRFRINVFRDRGSVATAVRRIEDSIPRFEELNLPLFLKKIARLQQGLVLFAGPTGQGKSTSIASLLDVINRNRKEHIITIEDPIEYLLRDKKSIVNQREIGIDVPNFHKALKYVVRQDPDVILLGEMRDRKSFDAGLMAAETGHLVFGTLHASSAHGTISRILDLFPSDREGQIRRLLEFNLKGIVCQKLMPSTLKDTKMVPAVENLFVNSTVQKLIRNEDDQKIKKVIQGGENEDMQTFNQSIKELLDEEKITQKTALKYSPNPEQLKMNIQGISLEEDARILDS